MKTNAIIKINQNRIKSYLTFSRSEWLAILVLTFIILLVNWLPDVLIKLFPPEFPSIKVISETCVLVNGDTLSVIEPSQAQFSPTQQKHAHRNPFAIQSYPIELNSADSLSIVKLYRIGPHLCSKILHYRKQLNGFHSLHQLEEIFGFDPDILFDLKDKIMVNPKLIKTIPINTVSLDELQTHPYFKIKLSRLIINYRTQHGPFPSLESLQVIPGLSDTVLHKIKPYLSFQI